MPFVVFYDVKRCAKPNYYTLIQFKNAIFVLFSYLFNLQYSSVQKLITKYVQSIFLKTYLVVNHFKHYSIKPTYIFLFHVIGFITIILTFCFYCK